MRTLVAVSLAVVLTATAALADDDTSDFDPRTQSLIASLHPEARPHATAGFKAFNAKDFRIANAEFEAAYKLDPEVPLLFVWAQAERLGGNCTKAVELFQKYLYSDINKAQADAARSSIKECGGVVAQKPVEKPRPPVVVEEPSTYVWYKDKPADALVAGGIVAGVIATVFFVHAGSAASDADAAMFLDDHDRLRADAIHDRNVGIAVSITGAVLVGAGVGVYLYHGRHHDAAVTSDGKSVGVAFRW